MKFLVVTFAPLLQRDVFYYSYAPYVREMEIWFRHVEEVAFCCPTYYTTGELLVTPFSQNHFKVYPVPELATKDLGKPWKIIYALINIYKAMRWADHIHLRCPGNIGLLGAFLQILFPTKKKTAKYAGNWDWNSRQPWSYRLQQRILRNTFLTRNMTALVYGEWPDRTQNILPFFTASYSEADKTEVVKPDIRKEVRLAFVGTLSPNKSPLTSLEVLKLLSEKGITARLTYCGEGSERTEIEKLAKAWNLQANIELLGNVSAEKVKEVLQQAHFLVFISRSEGWPKAVAEAMWWGCVPITTAVSCVPQMLGNGERGFLVKNDANEIAMIIEQALKESEKLFAMRDKGMYWARKYTMERFEEEILKLVY